MNDPNRKRFSLRQFFSVAAAFCFAALVVTGLVLFVTPPGRVANWTGWTMAGLTKDEWGDLHVAFGLLFLISGSCHLYFNWKPLLGYFKNRRTRRFAPRVEWVLALLLACAAAFGALQDLPPFSSLLALRDRAKASWEQPARRAPIPHAELMTLPELAEKAGLSHERLLANLLVHDIAPEPGDPTLRQIAETHGLTPQGLYALALGDTAAQRPGRGSRAEEGGARGPGGRGFGRKTLSEYCAERNLSFEEALAKLQARGIEADGQTSLRDAAFAAGLRPPEIIEILED